MFAAVAICGDADDIANLLDKFCGVSSSAIERNKLCLNRHAARHERAMCRYLCALAVAPVVNCCPECGSFPIDMLEMEPDRSGRRTNHTRKQTRAPFVDEYHAIKIVRLICSLFAWN